MPTIVITNIYIGMLGSKWNLKEKSISVFSNISAYISINQ